MEFKRDKYLNELVSKKNNSLIEVITARADAANPIR